MIEITDVCEVAHIFSSQEHSYHEAIMNIFDLRIFFVAKMRIVG